MQPDVFWRRARSPQTSAAPLLRPCLRHAWQDGLVSFFSGDYLSAVGSLEIAADNWGVATRARLSRLCQSRLGADWGRESRECRRRASSRSADPQRNLTDAQRRFISPRVSSSLNDDLTHTTYMSQLKPAAGLMFAIVLSCTDVSAQSSVQVPLQLDFVNPGAKSLRWQGVCGRRRRCHGRVCQPRRAARAGRRVVRRAPRSLAGIGVPGTGRLSGPCRIRDST
jgi:hypothetical protein